MVDDPGRTTEGKRNDDSDVESELEIVDVISEDYDRGSPNVYQSEEDLSLIADDIAMEVIGSTESTSRHRHWSSPPTVDTPTRAEEQITRLTRP